MSRLRWAAALLCAVAIVAAGGVASAAVAPMRHDGIVAAQVDGHTYVLLGPSVFGVTVQQDPLAYRASKLTDGAVQGRWRYDYWQAGQVDRPGDLGGSDPWEDAESCQHSGSTPRSCASAR